jgi:hypothetical protein
MLAQPRAATACERLLVAAHRSEAVFSSSDVTGNVIRGVVGDGAGDATRIRGRSVL